MNYPDLQRDILEEFAAFPVQLDYRKGQGITIVNIEEKQRTNAIKLKEWRKSNPEKLRAQQERARPQKLASLAKWKKANPEKQRAYAERYRAKKRTQRAARGAS